MPKTAVTNNTLTQMRPAGTGKTHVTRAVAGAWAEQGGSVVGLALSQNAAQVLGDAAGIPAQNIEKWLHSPAVPAVAGLLVIVDEAAMGPTAKLDRVVGRVCAAGGKVLLVGDPEQLAAPGAGGGMRLIVDDVGAARLDEVRRFGSPWEAEASLQLRAGNPAGLAEYDVRARIVGGTAEEMEAAAYRAWLADTLRGRTSLLMADTNEQVAALSAQARVDLVRLGRVEPAGVPLADANRAGVGDRIVTRLNDWDLRDHTGRPVVNREQWVVEAVGADGSLRVHRDGAPGHESDQVLPAGYVADHVELAYASTGHGAQGRTVDTGHAVFSERSSRQGVYVQMTRGREGNWAYVACDVHPGQDQERVIGDPVGTLAQVLGTADPGLAATQVLRDGQEAAESLHTLHPQWKDAVEQHAQTRWAAAIDDTVSPHVADRIRSAPAWPTLTRRLEQIEAAGGDATTVLADAVNRRELDSAADAAKVIYTRLNQVAVDVSVGPAGVDRTFVEATPAPTGGVGAEPVLAYARQVAERMDARIEALAERALQEPPPWLGPLGPVPQDPADRLQWGARAGVVAAYRELAAVESDDPLGDRPGPTRPESQARWDAANQALHGLPPTAGEISDEDLQAIVDRGEQLAGQAPPIVVEDLRRAEQQARAAETDLGLVELSGPEPTVGDVKTAVPVEDRAAGARADSARLEERHQARQDWVAEHGPDFAAAQAASAELVRRGDEWAARPFAGLSPQELANEIANVEDDLADLEQRTDNLMASIDTWDLQAASWDQQADEVDWEKPEWTRHTQDRQAETAAVARLTELTGTLERSALRGGPRGRERVQLQAEAGRIRQAHPALAADTDHTGRWDERGETAWAKDKTAAQDLRTKADHARSQAASARQDLPGITDTQQGLWGRLEQLTNETRMRAGEPAVPTAQSARQFERSRPKRSLNSTEAPGAALDQGSPIALEPERGRPPQR